MTSRNRDLGWSVLVESSPEGGAVRHHGVLFYAESVATWTRSDGLVVVVSFRVDADRGAEVTGYSVTAADGESVGSDATRLPILTMASECAKLNAVRKPGAEKEPVRMGPVRALRTDGIRLQHVADLYIEAVAAQEPVAEYVGSRLDVAVGKRTAEGLIGRARREGLLPPSKPGRKPKPKQGGSS